MKSSQGNWVQRFTLHIHIASWEKGAIENMNVLVRQYIPKRTDFRGISRGYARKIVEKLNNRPRKKNGFPKPADMINDKIV